MPSNANPARATSPIKGVHDVGRTKSFTRPPSINFGRFAGALSPMRSLLNQMESQNRVSSNQGHISQHGRHYNSNIMSIQRPPVNDTQHARSQSEHYMDPAYLQANYHDRGQSMNVMVSPQRESFNTPSYGRDSGRYVDYASLRRSGSQHSKYNSTGRMTSPQRLPVSASAMDLNALAVETPPQQDGNDSKFLNSPDLEIDDPDHRQNMKDMLSTQRPQFNDSQYGVSLPSRLPISTTSPNRSQLTTHVSRLSRSRSSHSYHSVDTLNFYSRIHGQRHLRRVVPSVDLRSYHTTTAESTSGPSNDKLNSGVDVSHNSGGGIGIPKYLDTFDLSSDLTYGPSFYGRPNEEGNEENTRKVMTWRHTAHAGMDEGNWPRSPLTPRPFTSQELGGRTSYHEAPQYARNAPTYRDVDPEKVKKEGVEEDGDNVTPRPSIRARQLNPLQQDRPIQDLADIWSPAGEEEGGLGTGFAALAAMHRAQEQVRLGVDLPPLSPIGAYRIDRTRVGAIEVAPKGPSGPVAPIFEPSPPTKHKAEGDPVKVNTSLQPPSYTPLLGTYKPVLQVKDTHSPQKKPSPLKLQPAVTEDPVVRDLYHPRSDPQTYTTEGLTQVLYKVYTPSHLPPDVLAALPSNYHLQSLSNPTTPAGHTAHLRYIQSPNLPTELSSKERNYITYYIDTLLQRNLALGKEVQRLEGDAEDSEVSKAGMQSAINKWFFEARESKVRGRTLETFIEDLVMNVVPHDKKQEASAVAMSMGIEIEYVEEATQTGKAGGDIGVAIGAEEEEDRAAVAKRQMRLEEEVKYWKARAAAADRFVGALG